MEKQYNVNCGKQYLKILSLLPDQRNCSGAGERYANLHISPTISGEVTVSPATFLSLWEQRLLKIFHFPYSTSYNIGAHTHEIFLRDGQ